MMALTRSAAMLQMARYGQSEPPLHWLDFHLVENGGPKALQLHGCCSHGLPTTSEKDLRANRFEQAEIECRMRERMEARRIASNQVEQQLRGLSPPAASRSIGHKRGTGAIVEGPETACGGIGRRSERQTNSALHCRLYDAAPALARQKDIVCMNAGLTLSGMSSRHR